MDEDHHHHYGGAGVSNSNSTQTPMTDFRQFFSPIPTHHQQFHPPPATIYSPAAAFPHHYDAMMLAMGGGGQDLSSAVATVPSSSSAGGGSASAFGLAGGDGGATARWPRQETLTLLEIRSRLDHKFKEANHKGPLWDEVSRIMCEEHGYQRSGKKCREKFENLYKYYKKTKEGKAGRQDGKHYRFFRQLEALYGDNSINQNHHQIIFPTTTTTTATASLSTSSDFSASSSDEEDAEKKGWKGKIKEFIESQMRKVMEKQESWLEKMMSSLEHREKERVMREEEWRKQEVMRMEREHRFWARERAWIEARDKALMDALGRITGKDVGAMLVNDDQRWEEEEMMKLVELRASVQDRFDQCCGNGPRESCIWDEISSRMACLGHERSAKMCKEKWDFISKELEKKRISHHQEHHHYQHHQNTNLGWAHEQVLGPTPPQSTMNDSCMRILLGDGGGGGGGSTSWESYGVKLNKGD